ncbi:GH1 family beta-glucosidase [Deinococcus pimensis]|uniref:GH1 family beta-glucosidase n=1 Tax=Deinococcus pimensis TaxID=309888 RepID=UPI0004AF93BE|nr:GH1 family beta-glucosidase [Deinococcus pimensis]
MTFPKHFRWGVATASYQIEGSPTQDGGGDSVWDLHTRRAGTVWDHTSGLVACDHARRASEDVALMREHAIGAYRLSLSWPRVLPDGRGRVNDRGLAFYDRLVDDLLHAGIEPWVTLFHWDFPLALYYQGGWLNRDSSDWFADYTRVIVDRLSDRVRHWFTLNEPQCFVGLGHRTGVHAPGDQLGWEAVLRVGHHALMAHGKAVQVIRAHARSAPTVGYAPVGVVATPATSAPEDVDAAREMMFSLPKGDTWNNPMWLDPVLRGHYPEGLEAAFDAAPPVRAGDLEVIHQPLDFLGANVYNGGPVTRAEDGSATRVPYPPGLGRTMYGWPVTPDALYWGPRFYHEQYGLPVVITENGVSLSDWVDLDGHVRDFGRVDFLRRYLLELERAVRDGVDVLGYFHWSWMDNFEWQEGYKQRFGLVHVDFTTQKRTPKASAAWYRDVIRSNGAQLHQPWPAANTETAVR